MITLERIKSAQLIENEDRMVARWLLYDRVIPLAKTNKLWLEFGVHSGATINYLSRFAPVMFGFDSFEGLPEQWQPGFPKGTFSTGGVLPQVNKNVVLVKGWFADTLPKFVDIIQGPIGLLHIDSDLYSSAKTVLNLVKDRLANETVIIFDELYNYGNYQDHEFKALNELAEELCDRYYIEPIARTNYEQVAFWVMDKKISDREYYELLFGQQ